MRRWVILNGILAVIVLALGVQIVRTWARTLPPVEARAPGKVADAPARTGEGGGKRGKRAQIDKSTQTPAALVTAIVNKDLFDPSRSKPTETVAAPTAAPHIVDPPPGISLVGVRMFGRDREGFILDATQANAQRRIRSGDTVGNFTVKSIRSSSVVLVSATGDYVTLSLEIDKSKNPTGAPPARPGRPHAPTPPGANTSPAAGVTAGTSTAAGIGAPKPPTITPPASAPGVVAGTPPQPVPPAAVPPRHSPPSPNLPEGVRQKLEQMKGLNKK
jgi:hypothetical protein